MIYKAYFRAIIFALRTLTVVMNINAFCRSVSFYLGTQFAPQCCLASLRTDKTLSENSAS